MTKLKVFFPVLALTLAACATHTPPVQPTGPLRPVNGAQQAGMLTPDGSCYHPIADKTAAKTRMACPAQ